MSMRLIKLIWIIIILILKKYISILIFKNTTNINGNNFFIICIYHIKSTSTNLFLIGQLYNIVSTLFQNPHFECVPHSISMTYSDLSKFTNPSNICYFLWILSHRRMKLVNILQLLMSLYYMKLFNCTQFSK